MRIILILVTLFFNLSAIQGQNYKILFSEVQHLERGNLQSIVRENGYVIWYKKYRDAKNLFRFNVTGIQGLFKAIRTGYSNQTAREWWKGKDRETGKVIIFSTFIRERGAVRIILPNGKEDRYLIEKVIKM